MQLADLFEQHIEQLASIEALDNGKAYNIAKAFDVAEAAACLRYYGGWADKEHGKVIEVDNSKMAITKHEPIGVVGSSRPRPSRASLSLTPVLLSRSNHPLGTFALVLEPARLES